MDPHVLDRLVVDVELSNRCNASCDFCPRDRTPHQGFMRPDVWDQTLRRIVELRSAADRRGQRVSVSFCGLGEGMLNPLAPDAVRSAVDAGFTPAMCANGSLLDERRANDLLDAGLARLFVNCGDLGDAYDQVYGLPFERLEANLVRFQHLSAGRCELVIVLVDHHQDAARVGVVRRHWQSLGMTSFFRSPMLNRSGSLEVPGMRYADDPARGRALDVVAARDLDPVCSAPFVFPFVGYDGHYYLCSSDWEKRGRFGSVFDRSFDDVVADKLAYERQPGAICRECNHDPVNKVIDSLQGRPVAGRRDDGPVDLSARLAIAGEVTSAVERFVERCSTSEAVAGREHRGGTPVPVAVASPVRR